MENHNLSETIHGGAKIVSRSKAKVFHYRNTDRKIKRGVKLRDVTDVRKHRFAADIVKKISQRHANGLKHGERLYRKQTIPYIGLM